ncbi:Cysteine-rich receptor-like protein kinase 25 [Carex littledalei]|uniref:Cysteine-rich receptor-like protein kinase 25 n=1 Tax=Carex littledalei TaxID=544730 RepID=A0A833QEP4_9POAL|nr:Cysteine-rich receptor-like protein kinase 25 [Carex littledalei]
MPTDINSFFSLFLLTLLAFVTCLNGYKEELHYYNCSSSDNYTDGSTYLGNLQVLLSSFISNTASTKLFYFNNTVGKDSDRVYGMAMCYAYDDLGYCQDCVTQAAKEILQYCPYSKSGVIWYWPCRLRYSNQNFFSVLHTSPQYYHYENDNVTESIEFTNELDQVINQLIARVITLPQLFALNQSKVAAANKTMYAFVQCTEDLKSDECGQCLKKYNEKLIKCCGRKDITVLSGLSCHIVFALWSFYPSDALVLNPPVLPGPQSPSLPPTYVTAPAQPPQIQKIVRGINREKWSKIVGVSVGAVAAALVLAVAGIWLWRRQSIANTSIKLINITNSKNVLDDFQVWQHVEEGKIDQLKDPVLDNASSEEVMKFIHIGLLCVQEDPTKRPNMAAISGMLHRTNTTSIPALPSSPDTTSSMPSVLFSTSEKSTS